MNESFPGSSKNKSTSESNRNLLKNTIVTLGLLAGTIEGIQAQNPSLHGSKESQRKQNIEIDIHHLRRIENKTQLHHLEKIDSLVKITPLVQLSEHLEKHPDHCFVRPWTNDFLIARAKKFKILFGDNTHLQINSAVRTIEDQKDLAKHNHNAAKTTGLYASSHPSGSSIDIAKNNLSHAEIVWMRKELLALEKQGLIEATEEHAQPCFHVMVFEKYSNHKKDKEQLAHNKTTKHKHQKT